MGIVWSWSDSAGNRQNVRLCAGRVLPGSPPTSSSSTAACQYVRCQGNRESTHSNTTQHTSLFYFFPFLLNLMLNKTHCSPVQQSASPGGHHTNRIYVKSIPGSNSAFRSDSPLTVVTSAEACMWSLCGFPLMSLMLVKQDLSLLGSEVGVFALMTSKFQLLIWLQHMEVSTNQESCDNIETVFLKTRCKINYIYCIMVVFCIIIS